jgi:hypothetical protein
VENQAEYFVPKWNAMQQFQQFQQIERSGWKYPSASATTDLAASDD